MEQIDDSALISQDVSTVTTRTLTEPDVTAVEYVGPFWTFMNILNLIHGAGLVAISNSFVACGLIPSICIFLTAAIICYGSGVFMFVLEKKLRTDNYGDMVRMTLGRWGGGFFHASILVVSYASLISCIVVAGRTVVSWATIVGVEISDESWLYKGIVFAYSLGIPVAFTIPRNAAFLNAFSTFSIVCLGVYIAVICYEAGYRLPPIAATVSTGQFDLTFLNSYSVHVLTLSIAAYILPIVSVTRPSIKERIQVVSGAFWTSVVIIGTTGTLGYLMFGAEVLDNILESFDASNIDIVLVRVSYFIVITATYPAIAMTVSTSFSQIFFAVLDPNTLSNGKRAVVLLMTNSIPVCVGVLLPVIKPAIAIGGAFGGSVTNLVFPPLMWIKCSGERLSHWKNITAICVFIFGILCTIICTYEAVVEAMAYFGFSS